MGIIYQDCVFAVKKLIVNFLAISVTIFATSQFGDRYRITLFSLG